MKNFLLLFILCIIVGGCGNDDDKEVYDVKKVPDSGIIITFTKDDFSIRYDEMFRAYMLSFEYTFDHYYDASSYYLQNSEIIGDLWGEVLNEGYYSYLGLASVINATYQRDNNNNAIFKTVRGAIATLENAFSSEEEVIEFLDKTPIEYRITIIER